jgi:hypothetical protein
MSKLISNARGYFRKKNAARANSDESNSEPAGVLKKRLNSLSMKMAKLKLQLLDVSLAYLHVVQDRLQEKMSRARQRRQPDVRRRKLGTLALRLKSTAKGVFDRVRMGKVVTFPDARDGSPTKGPNS